MLLSMSEAWEDAQAFVRREFGLLAPLGVSTLGTALLIYQLIVPDVRDGSLPPGPWMWGLIPVLLLFMVGGVAISALVLLPRASVGEALRVGVARLLPATLLMIGFGVAAAVVVLLLSLVAVAVGAALGWAAAQSGMLAVVLALPVLLWVSIRLLPIWALIAERGGSDSLRALMVRCFALTRNVFWRLLSATLLFMLASLLISSAIQFAFGSMLLLAGRLIGDPGLGILLTHVLMALVGSVVQAIWIVYVATIYRRLASSSGM